VLQDLVASADALTSNLQGDVPEKLGLTCTRLKAVNAKIVCARRRPVSIA
jgi:crotonobetainyl-CoA:carnitine CoA-transferase CaiB-like acyl-CoA transferase